MTGSKCLAVVEDTQTYISIFDFVEFRVLGVDVNRDIDLFGRLGHFVQLNLYSFIVSRASAGGVVSAMCDAGTTCLAEIDDEIL